MANRWLYLVFVVLAALLAACGQPATPQTQAQPHSPTLKALAVTPGTVVGWGNNNVGQTTIPAGLSNVSSIAAGGYHNLALKQDGTVVGWGDNFAGQINIPADLTNVKAIAAGEEHSLALLQNGTVVGWGSNDGGQTNIPAGLSNVSSIAAGFLHSLALVASCPAGKYFDGTNCVDATPGHYVPNAVATSQIDCAIGSYQDAAGATSCKPAAAGNYVDTTAAIAQTPCAVGTYQDATGQISCKDATPGHYVSLAGQPNQTECAAGSYQPNSGATSCTSASPGNFVANSGQAAQTPCPAGSYQPSSGATSCTSASAGFYVPNTGATTQLQCPSGTTSDAGATACRPIDTTPPVITPTITGTLGLNGWYTSNVTVSWTISDPESTPTPSTCASTTLTSNTAGTNVTCAASSLGGSNSQTVTIKIDKTPPACTAKVNTVSLWSPNHKLTNVSTTVTPSNGAVGFKLLSVSSSEADSGLGTDDVPGDIQGWVIGTADTSGQLRSERYSSSGRTYTFVYQASDIAGNTANCTASVSVPKSQGK